MKKLLICAMLIVVSTPAGAEILAKLNGKAISSEEVERSLAEVATMEDGADPKLNAFPQDFQKAFVGKYIEKQLIVDAARRAGVHKDAEVVDEVKSFEDNLVQQKYLTDLVLKQRTEKRLREIYNAKFKAREGKTEVHAAHILVKTEEEAKKIKKEIDSGADFDELAEKYSIDPGAKVSSGDVGYFTMEEKLADFSKAAFAMKNGEISAPVKTDLGWHIIKVYDKRKVKSVNYAEALSEVEGELAAEVIDNEVNRLKKSAKIEYLGNLSDKNQPIKPQQPVAEVPAAAEKKATEINEETGAEKTVTTTSAPSVKVEKPSEAPAAATTSSGSAPASVPVKPAVKKRTVAPKPLVQTKTPTVTQPVQPLAKPSSSVVPNKPQRTKPTTSTNINQKPTNGR